MAAPASARARAPEAAGTVRVDQLAFAREASAIANFARGLTPLLGAVRVHASGGQLTLSATDDTTTATATVPASEGELDVLVSPKELSAAARAAAGDNIRMHVDDMHLVLNSTAQHATLAVIDAGYLEGGYPHHPPQPAARARLPRNGAHQALSTVSAIVQVPNDRPALEALQLAFEGEHVAQVAGSDGYRVAVYDLQGATSPAARDVVQVHKTAADRILGFLSRGRELEIGQGQHGARALISFTSENRSVVTSPYLGNRLPYEKHTAPPTTGAAHLPTRELTEIAAEAKRLGTRAVRLDLREGEIRFTAGHGENRIEHTVAAPVNGPEHTVLFNAEYLADFARLNPHPITHIAYNVGQTPALMTGAENQTADPAPGLRYLLMPMAPPKTPQSADPVAPADAPGFEVSIPALAAEVGFLAAFTPPDKAQRLRSDPRALAVNLRFADGELTATVSDGRGFEATSTLPATGNQPAEASVDARELAAALAGRHTDQVRLTVRETALVLGNGTGSMSLPRVEPVDGLGAVTAISHGTFDAAALGTALGEVARAAGVAESRTSHVHVDLDEHHAALSATDNRAIAAREIDYSPDDAPDGERAPAIDKAIPAAHARLIAKSLPTQGTARARFALETDDRRPETAYARVTSGPRTIRVRLQEISRGPDSSPGPGYLPMLREHAPGADGATATVEAEALRTAARRIVNQAGKHEPIRLRLDQARLTLATRRASVEIPAEYPGPAFATAVLPDHLRTLSASATGRHVHLHTGSSPLRPLLWTGTDTDEALGGFQLLTLPPRDGVETQPTVPAPAPAHTPGPVPASNPDPPIDVPEEPVATPAWRRRSSLPRGTSAAFAETPAPGEPLAVTLARAIVDRLGHLGAEVAEIDATELGNAGRIEARFTVTHSDRSTHRPVRARLEWTDDLYLGPDTAYTVWLDATAADPDKDGSAETATAVSGFVRLADEPDTDDIVAQVLLRHAEDLLRATPLQSATRGAVKAAPALAAAQPPSAAPAPDGYSERPGDPEDVFEAVSDALDMEISESENSAFEPFWGAYQAMTEMEGRVRDAQDVGGQVPWEAAAQVAATLSQHARLLIEQIPADGSEETIGLAQIAAACERFTTSFDAHRNRTAEHARPALPGPDAPAVDRALALAERGLAVFPVRAGEKSPPLVAFTREASSDPKAVRAMFEHLPTANIGVAAEDSRLLVLDLDVKPERGQDGLASLAALARHRPVPRTFTVRSASGGRHLYFALPPGATARNSVDRLGENLDVRGAGGYIVAPTSRLRDPAGLYVLEHDAPIAEVPAWLLDELSKTAAPADAQGIEQAPGEVKDVEVKDPAQSIALAVNNAVKLVAEARVGQRNTTLYDQARRIGRYLGHNPVDEAAVRTQLFRAGLQADPKAGREEQAKIHTTIGNGFRDGRARPVRLLAQAARDAQPPGAPAAQPTTAAPSPGQPTANPVPQLQQHAPTPTAPAQPRSAPPSPITVPPIPARLLAPVPALVASEEQTDEPVASPPTSAASAPSPAQSAAAPETAVPAAGPEAGYQQAEPELTGLLDEFDQLPPDQHTDVLARLAPLVEQVARAIEVRAGQQPQPAGIRFAAREMRHSLQAAGGAAPPSARRLGRLLGRLTDASVRGEGAAHRMVRNVLRRGLRSIAGVVQRNDAHFERDPRLAGLVRSAEAAADTLGPPPGPQVSAGSRRGAAAAQRELTESFARLLSTPVAAWAAADPRASELLYAIDLACRPAPRWPMTENGLHHEAAWRRRGAEAAEQLRSHLGEVANGHNLDTSRLAGVAARLNSFADNLDRAAAPRLPPPNPGRRPKPDAPPAASRIALAAVPARPTGAAR